MAGGTLTGRGGDIILIDDPHKPEDMASDAKRVAVLDWYRSTLLSRLNDPQHGAILLIQQRVHQADLAGTLLEQSGWDHLDLQAIAEAPVGIALSRGRRLLRKEGDLLHAERLPGSFLERRREEVGFYAFAAQYQQRPAPLGGGLVKWAWFRSFDGVPERQPGNRIVQSRNTASKAGETNDYSVCTAWLVRKGNVWLLDLFRARLEFPELRCRVEAAAHRHGARTILIEEAGSGVQLVQDLKRHTRPRVIGVVPKSDKVTRLVGVTPMIEGGRVAVPASPLGWPNSNAKLPSFQTGNMTTRSIASRSSSTGSTSPGAVLCRPLCIDWHAEATIGSFLDRRAEACHAGFG